MARKAKSDIPVGCSCQPLGYSSDSCQIEALVSVDDRGQMVLPKELREKAGIAAGDKLAIVSWSRDGVIASISLVKADVMAAMLKAAFKPK